MNLAQKTDWTNRALEHQAADRFIQGCWIKEDEEKIGGFYRGCMFGCMTQSNERTIQKASEEMDLPEWINKLAERVFEGLPADEATLFPALFVQAMPLDLTEGQYVDIWHKTSAARLRRTLQYIKGIEDQWGINDAVNTVIDLHESEWDESAAESAAWSAARSAESAAASAKSAAASAASAAASAKSAALSAKSAALSAKSAALSAASAAWSAAWSAASAEYQAERDFLLNLLTEMSKNQ